MRNVPWFLVLAAALGTVPACSIKKLTIDTSAELMRDGSRAFEAEPDLEIARGAAPGQLKTVEGMLESAPKHRILLEMAARGTLEFAFGFLEDDVQSARDKDARRVAVARATDLYERSFLYSIRYLETFDPGIPRAVETGGAAFEAAVAKLPKDSVPGLAYGGMALASLINLNRGDPSRVADLPKARVLVERAHALDPKFYYGGPAMTLGIISVQAGKDDTARAYFSEADAVSGGKYLLPRVMMARTLLVETHDPEGFRSTLESVLAEPRDLWPQARLANQIAKRRAARYLHDAHELF